MRKMNLFTKFFMLIFLFSCGVNPKFSTNKTSVSETNVNKRMDLIGKKFSSVQICDDLLLSKLLIESIHNNDKVVNSDEVCSGKYEDFVTQIRSSILSLKDFHTAFAFGFGLDASSYPVVKGCVGSCPDFKGSPLIAIPSPVDGAYYASYIDSSRNIGFVRIDRVDGIPIEDVFEEYRFEGTPSISSIDKLNLLCH